MVRNRWRKEAVVPSATIALEAEKARHSPCLPKRPNGLQAKRSKKAALYLFRGFSERGGDNTPFSFAQTRDSKKLENIRENAILRNLESTESSVEILKNEKTQNLGSTESKVDSKTITESSCIDSKTYAESKGILRSEQRQNLTIKESAESRF